MQSWLQIVIYLSLISVLQAIRVFLFCTALCVLYASDGNNEDTKPDVLA